MESGRRLAEVHQVRPADRRIREHGLRLRPTGRYAHGRAHVEAAARAAGLELVSCEEVPLRQDDGGTIHG